MNRYIGVLYRFSSFSMTITSNVVPTILWKMVIVYLYLCNQCKIQILKSMCYFVTQWIHHHPFRLNDIIKKGENGLMMDSGGLCRDQYKEHQPLVHSCPFDCKSISVNSTMSSLFPPWLETGNMLWLGAIGHDLFL